jgi:hypothetical protein
MSTLIKREQAAHWYKPDGTACHTIIGKNGKERNTDLRDARKLGLYPSVTTILKVMAKPGLQAWIVEQGILSALTLPRTEGEPLDAFAARVATDMDAQRDQAANLGTLIHDAIKSWLNGLMPDSSMEGYVEGFRKWAHENNVKPICTERHMTSGEWGFAGQTDLFAEVNGRRLVVDYKSQKFKNGKPAFYEDWPIQLSAYARMLMEAGEKVDGCMSLAIDVEGICPVVTKEWPDMEKDFAAFASAFSLWKYLKDFNPLDPVEAVTE